MRAGRGTGEDRARNGRGPGEERARPGEERARLGEERARNGRGTGEERGSARVREAKEENSRVWRVRPRKPGKVNLTK